MRAYDKSPPVMVGITLDIQIPKQTNTCRQDGPKPMPKRVVRGGWLARAQIRPPKLVLIVAAAAFAASGGHAPTKRATHHRIHSQTYVPRAWSAEAGAKQEFTEDNWLEKWKSEEKWLGKMGV